MINVGVFFYSFQLVAISKEEYLRAYTEYMFNVRRRRESQRGEPNNAKHRRKHAEIFLESIEPLKQELQQGEYHIMLDESL